MCLERKFSKNIFGYKRHQISVYRIKKYHVSNENELVWTGPKILSKEQRKN